MLDDVCVCVNVKLNMKLQKPSRTKNHMKSFGFGPAGLPQNPHQFVLLTKQPSHGVCVHVDECLFLLFFVVL